MTTGQQPMSRAERARVAAQQEKDRVAALEKKGAEEAGDVVDALSNTAGTTGGPSTTSGVVVQSAPQVEVETSAPQPDSSNGGSADRPISSGTGVDKPPSRTIPNAAEKKKVDRQGIDLRPEDRERVIRFEMFCLQNRLKTGKKRGLSLYARAGFQLLEELMATDRAKAEALLRSLGEKR